MTPRTSLSARRALPLALFLLFFSVSPGRIIAFDVAVRAAVARALWTHGSPFVEANNAVGAGLVNVAGRGATSFYGIGQSLSFIPFDWLGHQLSKLPHLSEGLRATVETMPIVWLYTPLIGVLWWWGIALSLSEWGVTSGAARRFAACFLFATVAGVYAATTAQEESIVGTLVIGAFVAMMRWCRHHRDRDGALVGLLLGSALLFRLNSVFAFIPILGYAIDQQPPVWRTARGVAMAALGAFPPLLLFAVFAQWRFGNWHSTGYDLALQQGLGVQWTSARPWLALSLLFGPGKGLLLLSLPALLGLVGLAVLLPRHPRFAIGTVLAFAIAALLCSRIVFNPDGSECWSVRYLAHLLPLLAYPAWVGMRRLGSRALVNAIFAIGIACQLAALFAPDSLEYQQSIARNQHPYSLIGNPTTGQLALRLRNITSWVLHRQVAEPRTPAIDRMAHDYIPNLWGPAYARKAGGRFLAALFLVTWLAVALATIGLIAIVFTPRGARQRRHAPANEVGLRRVG